MFYLFVRPEILTRDGERGKSANGSFSLLQSRLAVVFERQTSAKAAVCSPQIRGSDEGGRIGCWFDSGIRTRYPQIKSLLLYH